MNLNVLVVNIGYPGNQQSIEPDNITRRDTIKTNSNKIFIELSFFYNLYIFMCSPAMRVRKNVKEEK